MKYKHRDYSNKLLSNTEWNYLKKNNYSIYKNVGLCIIRFFDRQYKPDYSIPKLREKYKIRLKNKSGLIVKHNSIEKMLAVCSLGKKYKAKTITTLEYNIAKKLQIEHLVCSLEDIYYDDGKGHRCRICGVVTRKIASHLTNHHKMTDKQYYDKYLKKENEGICVICGKPTKFLDSTQGYRKTCSEKCSHASTGISCKKTFLKKYNVVNISQLKETKEKVVNTCLKKYNVNCVAKIPYVREKSKKTLMRNYNVDSPSKSEVIKKRIERTNLKRYKVKCVFESEEIKNKIRETNRKNCGYDFWHQIPEFQEVVKKSNLDKWGVEYPNQTDENRKRMSKLVSESFPNRRNKHKGFLSEEERIFAKYLKKLGYKFKYEYKINNHNFDFAIFKNNNLDCLVDIDGEYWHGIYTDIGGILDNERYSKVPKKVKFIVIDSLKIEFGIREVIRVRNMTYKEWKYDMLSNIPKEITYPKYSNERLKRTFDLLQKETKFNSDFVRSNVGKSLLIHFCPKYCFRNVDYENIRNKLFYSPFSSKHFLEGYEDISNVPKLILKYKNRGNKIIVKHHSPEKMLAICSLGKTYVSKEPIDKESKLLAKSFKFSTFEQT